MAAENGRVAARAAGPCDAGTLARLLHDFNTEFDTETDDVDVLTTRFERLLGLDAVLAVLAADESGEPVGFALLTLRPVIWFDGPLAVLDELYVVPDRRGGGVGTALLAQARARLVGRGCPELHINVDEVDADARRFYERHGFVNVEREADGRMLCYAGPTAVG